MRTLTPDELRAACFGAELVPAADRCWTLRRLPASLAALYEGNPALKLRGACPSGARLRFETDACAIRVAVRYRETARPFFKGAVLADDRPAGTFGPDAAAERWEGEAFRQPESRLRRLELWFPHASVCELESVVLDGAGRFAPAAPRARRWLAYGDSITQGMVASLPTLTYVARCAARLEADVTNFGVGGATLEEGLAETVPDAPFDCVTIAYGVNDFAHDLPAEAVGARAGRLFDALRRRQPAARVWLLTPLPWVGRTEPNKIGLHLDAYRRALADAAAGRADVTVVEGPRLVPDDARYYCDNIHPNDEGMAVYADALARALATTFPCPSDRPTTSSPL